MNRKDYEAKKARLKRVRDEAGRRLDAQRGTHDSLAYARAIELYTEAQEKLSRFIRNSVAHRNRRMERIAECETRRTLYDRLYPRIQRDDATSDTPRRDRPPTPDSEGDPEGPRRR
jgi:hypothetical protein